MTSDNYSGTTQWTGTGWMWSDRTMCLVRGLQLSCVYRPIRNKSAVHSGRKSRKLSLLNLYGKLLMEIRDESLSNWNSWTLCLSRWEAKRSNTPCAVDYSRLFTDSERSSRKSSTDLRWSNVFLSALLIAGAFNYWPINNESSPTASIPSTGKQNCLSLETNEMVAYRERSRKLGLTRGSRPGPGDAFNQANVLGIPPSSKR